MGIFFNRGRNENGLGAGLHAQIFREDARNRPNYPVNVPMFNAPAPGQLPGDPNPGDPRMRTADAQEAMQTIDRADRNSNLASTITGYIGGGLGMLAGGPFGAAAGMGIGKMLGGLGGEWASGIRPDIQDVGRWATTGLLSAGAGALTGGLAQGAGGLVGRTLGTIGGGFLGGQLALNAGSNMLGRPLMYSPGQRYFVNPNTREIMA